MAQTYDPIATQTLGSAAGNIIFSSIPAGYTDLILVVEAAMTTGTKDLLFYFNGDNTGTYSYTALSGDGSSASSSRAASQTSCYGCSVPMIDQTLGSSMFIINVMNYANTTTNKGVISRASSAASSSAQIIQSTWRSTAVINSITIWDYAGVTFKAGSKFTLFGIKAA